MRRTDHLTHAVGVIVAAQAIWIAIMAARGWFYQDDLTFLAQAVHRPLGWGYLSEPVNAHFTPGLRLQFWLLQRFAPFDAAISIIVRIALQAVATLLLWRLLVLLVGRRTGLLPLLLLYAFSPLLVPGTLWYAASANLLPAQLGVILALIWHVRSTVTGRLRFAIGAGLALLGAAACWEKAATIALALPVLSLAFLHGGSIAERLRAALRRWRNWLLTIGPLGAFVVYFVVNGYGSGASVPSPATLLRVARDTWWHSVAPSLVGGPWRWFSAPDVYESFSSPPVTLEVLAQVAILAVGVAGVLRTGRRSLWAWFMPVLVMMVGVVLVAAGRYTTFGALIDRAYTYVLDLAVPWTIAAALALFRPTPEVASPVEMPGTDSREPVESDRTNGRARIPTIAMITAACVVASSIVSATSYVHRWAQNPTERWYSTLRREVRAAGPQLNLWDTSAPADVLRLISEKHHISDVLDIAGLPARYDRSDSDPKIVDNHGHIRSATFLPVAHAMTSGPNQLCNDLIPGVTTRTQPLIGSPDRNEWFVHLEYFQQRPTTLYIRFLDAHGTMIVPVGGPRVVMSGGVGAVNLRLPFAAPRQLQIRSENAATNVCLTAALVGYPFARERTG